MDEEGRKMGKDFERMEGKLIKRVGQSDWEESREKTDIKMGSLRRKGMVTNKGRAGNQMGKDDEKKQVKRIGREDDGKND